MLEAAVSTEPQRSDTSQGAEDPMDQRGRFLGKLLQSLTSGPELHQTMTEAFYRHPTGTESTMACKAEREAYLLEMQSSVCKSHILGQAEAGMYELTGPGQLFSFPSLAEVARRRGQKCTHRQGPTGRQALSKGPSHSRLCS